LLEDGIIIQFGAPPNRIDLINKIDGVLFRDAWQGRATEKIRVKGNTIPLYYIGLRDLIANKSAIKRPKDIDDLKYLKSL